MSDLWIPPSCRSRLDWEIWVCQVHDALIPMNVQKLIDDWIDLWLATHPNERIDLDPDLRLQLGLWQRMTSMDQLREHFLNRSQVGDLIAAHRGIRQLAARRDLRQLLQGCRSAGAMAAIAVNEWRVSLPKQSGAGA